ncbi:MAG: N-acetylglucosamine-6-phosphate deacetylase [Anaerolineaceae bacterium]|nr:N-acetylglucosamine-6-phosphate deacetylase [Anaerolineaceae bacterium]
MKTMFCGKVYANGEWLENCLIRVTDGKIAEMIPNSKLTADAIDFSNAICSPGFVDMHIHGAFGHDTMDGDVAGLNTMSAFLMQHGTTSFLPTTMTATSTSVNRSLEEVNQCMHMEQPGARCLGVHLEGPFINPAAKGAQIENQIQLPSVESFDAMCGSNISLVKTITLAPEREGAEALIRYLSKKGIVPVIGHTKATYQQAKDSFDWGIRHATHMYNAMTPLHHREPGVVGALLEDERVTVELIADLVHVHPAVIKVTLAAKGSQQIALVTDAMSAAGLEAGTYQLGGQDVFMKDEEARLADGTLAGSVLTQDKALRNLAGQGIALEDILEMLTATPARIIGEGHRKGKLQVGMDADITILSDALEVQAVFIAGQQKK